MCASVWAQFSGWMFWRFCNRHFLGSRVLLSFKINLLFFMFLLLLCFWSKQWFTHCLKKGRWQSFRKRHLVHLTWQCLSSANYHSARLSLIIKSVPIISFYTLHKQIRFALGKHWILRWMMIAKWMLNVLYPYRVSHWAFTSSFAQRLFA